MYREAKEVFREAKEVFRETKEVFRETFGYMVGRDRPLAFDGSPLSGLPGFPSYGNHLRALIL